MKPVAIALAVAASLAGASAYAQCTKDTDCKGDRVCIGGQCADVARPQPAPGPAVAPPPPPPVQPVQPLQPVPQPQPVVVQPQPAPGQPVQVIVNNNAPAAQPAPQQALMLQEPKLNRKPPKSGWAIGAGVVGLIFGGVTLGLSGASEATKTEMDISLPLGITALVLAIVFIPVTASGGSSARRGTDLHGVIPLRVFGWILYAGMIATGLITAIYGVAVDTPPDGLIVSIGGMSALSFLFFAIDDFVSAGQAKALANRMERGEASLEVTEYVSPIVLRDGKVGVSAGVVGRF